MTPQICRCLRCGFTALFRNVSSPTDSYSRKVYPSAKCTACDGTVVVLRPATERELREWKGELR